MGQYLQFRSWLRSGSQTEKRAAFGASLLSLVLIVWTLFPTGGPPKASATGVGTAAVGGSGLSSAGNSAVGSAGAAVGSGASGSAGGAAGSGGATSGSATGSGAGTGSGSATGSGSGVASRTGSSSGSAGAAGSNCLAAGKSTDTGVTGSTVTVADILLNLAGAIGNSAVGQASPSQQQTFAQAMVDNINQHGGIDCRKLVVQYYQANPIDSTSSTTICQQLATAGVFAVIGGFAFPQGANDCLAQEHIPVIANEAPTPNEARQYYPYLMADSADPIQDYRNAILGVAQRGEFKGAKVAILEDQCSQEIDSAVNSLVAQAGVPSGNITVNSFACPSSGFASPSDMTNFATQDSLNKDNVVVVVTGGGSFKEFSEGAKSQNYKPTYVVGNYQGFMVTATGQTGPDPANFDGTVATTTTRFGLDTTPSVPVNSATQQCIAILGKENIPSSDVLGPYEAGNDCNLFWMFYDAATHDTNLSKVGLAPALASVGNFAEAFPNADGIFKTPGPTTPVKVSSGDYWWTVQFQASCTCWKVIDPTEHPDL